MADSELPTVPARPECPHLGRTSAYFDGALAPADEELAAAHLADCAQCEALLADAVGIDAVLSGPLSAAPAVASAGAGAAAAGRAEAAAGAGPEIAAPPPPRRRGRWPLVAGAAFAAAAAAALWIGLRPPAGPPAPAVVALELPAERALEARFTGARFAPHRKLGVLRGDRARESLPLAALAALEQRGELPDLVAALAAGGNTARATELAAGLPAGAAAESDRAALALAAGDLERALHHAYRAADLDPKLAAAHWNLALSARELNLPRLARAALARVIAAAEPGWADEARALDATLARDLAPFEATAAVERRGLEMATGGPPLSALEVAAAPSLARVFFLDAVRLATHRGRVDELRPLAAALDAHAGTDHAAAMLARAEPALAERFGARYRALTDRAATPDEAASLVAELRAAGPRADALRAGALILAWHRLPAEPAPWEELRAITAPWRDPWFELYVERERIAAAWSSDDIGAQPALEAALARCPTGPGAGAWAMRCGQLSFDLAKLFAATGRDDLARARAEEAAARFRAAGISPMWLRARSFAAEVHRRGGAAARARAEFEEVVLAAPESDCDVRRYARIGQAGLAAAGGAWDAARELLPPAAPPAGCTATHDVIGLSTAVDLARSTGDARDADTARRWIERTSQPAMGGFAVTAIARIARGGDAAASAALGGWVRDVGRAFDPGTRAAHAWAVATLVSDAGAREDWDAIFAIAARIHPAAANARCALIASIDVEDVTIAARVEAKLSGSHRRVPLAEQATARIVSAQLITQLADCDEVAVIARPPLHARADLLPAELAWWFAGDEPGKAPRPGPPRSLEVTDPRPPDPSLPRLSPAPSAERFDAAITGADATPSRVLAALADATYAELHVHGIASALDGDAAYLALSPDLDGTFALRAPAVRGARLRGAPLIVLGACRGAAVAPYLRQRWTLPDAFLDAGASAVVAVDVPISDASARRIFDDLHRRVAAGEPVAKAVAAIRASAPADAAWARRLMVFR